MNVLMSSFSIFSKVMFICNWFLNNTASYKGMKWLLNAELVGSIATLLVYATCLTGHKTTSCYISRLLVLFKHILECDASY